MTGRLLIDAVDLTAIAWNITDRASRFAVPGRRGDNKVLPGVHGKMHVPGKPYDENNLVFKMWAIGCNDDGTVSPDKAGTVRTNLDILTRLFAKSGLLTIVQERPDGDRMCMGEVVQSIDFTAMAGATRAEFAVEIRVPEAFWRGTSVLNQTVVTGTAGTAEIQFSSFAASAAPMTGMRFDVTGPVGPCTLTDPLSGQWVACSTPITAGAIWTIDSARWTSTLGGVNNIANVTHGGGATLLDLSPTPGGPRLTVSGSGKTTGTSVKLTGRTSFLLA